MEKQGKPFGIVSMSCAVALAMMAGSTHAADTGMVNFTGLIVPNTCTYPQTINVPLPTVRLAQLIGEPGQTAGLTKFDITFNNCPPGVSVRAGFIANPAYVNLPSGLLKNLSEGASGGAVAVEVALTDKDGNMFYIGHPRPDPPVKVDDTGKAILTYGAEYHAYGDPDMRPGVVTAAVSYVVEYL